MRVWMLPLLWTGGGEGGRKYCLTKFAFFEKMAGKFKTFKRNYLKQMYFTKEHVLVLISGLLPTLIIILIILSIIIIVGYCQF